MAKKCGSPSRPSRPASYGPATKAGLMPSTRLSPKWKDHPNSPHPEKRAIFCQSTWLHAQADWVANTLDWATYSRKGQSCWLQDSSFQRKMQVVPSNQPQGLESVCPQPALQDREHLLTEWYPPQGRLYELLRSKICLSFSPDSHGTQEIPEVQVEGTCFVTSKFQRSRERSPTQCWWKPCWNISSQFYRRS